MKNIPRTNLLLVPAMAAVLAGSTPLLFASAFATTRTAAATRSTPSVRGKYLTGDDRSSVLQSRGTIGFDSSLLSLSSSSSSSSSSPSTEPSPTAETEEYIEGGPVNELFVSKALDGLTFRLFGIGRREDEDVRGAFQPPASSMEGTVVVVTGASSGLGLESAKRLALAGATVVATARTPEKAARTVGAVRDYCRGLRSAGGAERTGYTNPNPIVRCVVLDLDDLEGSVRTFADRYRDAMFSLSKIRDRDTKRPGTNTKTIDVLLNNAGCGGVPALERTVDGYERTFQSCHLGHFALTARLFKEGLLTAGTTGDDGASKGSSSRGGGCTVINVASVAHRSAEILSDPSSEAPTYGFDFDGLGSGVGSSRGYIPTIYYTMSKLANVMFTRELQRRVDLAGKAGDLKAVSLEPGGVVTDIWRYTEFGYDPRDFAERIANGESLEQPPNLLPGPLPRLFSSVFTQVDRGANAQVWLAYRASCGSNDVVGGRHYDEFRKLAPVVRSAGNQASNERLWELSEELAGVRFDLGEAGETV